MMRAVLLALLLSLPSVALAQSESPLLDPGSPGPYALDVRGAIVGIPQAPRFYPTLPGGAAIPARGLGIEVGGHVYPLRLGPARVGFGLSLVAVRGTATTPGGAPGSDGVSNEAGLEPGPGGDREVVSRARILSPQVSFNFGTARGWSYLSVGAGPGRVTIEPRTVAGDAVVETSFGAVNVGGGARWFLNPHVGIGFDVRFYRLPSGTLVGASAGLSFK